MQCPHCGRESDPLFKFCLHCGRELSAQAPRPRKAPAPEPEPQDLSRITGHTDLPARQKEKPAAEPVAKKPAAEPVAKKPAAEPVAKKPAAEPVAKKPAAEPAVEPRARKATQVQQAFQEPEDSSGEISKTSVPEARNRCPRCKAMLQDGAGSCHLCGHHLGDEVPEERREATDIPSAGDGDIAGYLVSIDTATGREAARLPLHAGVNSLGRRGCDLVFPSDDLLSPHHVDIDLGQGSVSLVCPISLNGTFIRIDGPVKLEHGDLFRLGQQLLRFEEMRFVEPLVPEPRDGTRVLGSPTPSVVWGRLGQVVSTRLTASTFLLTGEQVRIGREKGDVTFPGDRYMSGSHALVIRKSDGYYLKDVGSSNGTFLRIKGRATFQAGRYFLAGRQLFRLENAA
ncbi:MAG: FHA domain-containing protein [Deltaproteobacteria bacterium]|nr:FHA domain-containing protein [Deltaproteobacteria bacterium]